MSGRHVVGVRAGPVRVFRQHVAWRRLWWLAPIGSLAFTAFSLRLQVQTEQQLDPTAPGLFDLARWPSAALAFSVAAYVSATWAYQTVIIDDSGVTIRSFWTARIPWPRVLDIRRVHDRVLVQCVDGTWFLPLSVGRWSSGGEACEAAREQWIASRGAGWAPPKVDPLMVDRDRHGHPVLRAGFRLRSEQLLLPMWLLVYSFAFQRHLTTVAGCLLLVGAVVALMSRRRVVVTDRHVNVLRWPTSDRIPRKNVIAVSERPKGMGVQIVLETTTGLVPLPFTIPVDAFGRKTEYYRQWTWLHDELGASRRTYRSAQPDGASEQALR